MNQKYLDNYIKIILQIGLNLQKDQDLIISSPLQEADFVHLITKEAYKMGANKVIVNWDDPELTKLKYHYEKLDNFKTIPTYNILKSEAEVENNACFLTLDGLDSQALVGISQTKLNTWHQTVHKYLNVKNNAIMNDLVSWCIAAIPTYKWALEVCPNSNDPINELWSLIFKMTRSDCDDPIKAWQTHIKHLNHYAQVLNDYQFQALHFKNKKGTNLEVGLVNNYQFLAAQSINKTNKQPFIANIPTEEVFSMPHNYKTNGIVYNSKPLCYHGEIIDDFYLEFKDGAVINFDAKQGKEVLASLLNVDNGAKRLGEVALVSFNTPISLENKLFYTTLFDENASCHIALGQAYPTTMQNSDQYDKETLMKMGMNDSAIHVDFMFGTKDLEIIGILDDKTVTIFKDGNFVI